VDFFGPTLQNETTWKNIRTLVYAIIFDLDALYTYLENVRQGTHTGGEKCGGAPLEYSTVFQISLTEKYRKM
jgi:hypothetical protein